jgi:hypothetical protein
LLKCFELAYIKEIDSWKQRDYLRFLVADELNLAILIDGMDGKL